MEMINKVELQGFVGAVRKTDIGKTLVVRFSVATDYTYVSMDGTPIVETTWHNCTAFADTNPDAENIKRADSVRVKGRIRMQKYVDNNGNDRTIPDIYVQELKIIG